MVSGRQITSRSFLAGIISLATEHPHMGWIYGYSSEKVFKTCPEKAIKGPKTEKTNNSS